MFEIVRHLFVSVISKNIFMCYERNTLHTKCVSNSDSFSPKSQLNSNLDDFFIFDFLKDQVMFLFLLLLLFPKNYQVFCLVKVTKLRPYRYISIFAFMEIGKHFCPALKWEQPPLIWFSGFLSFPLMKGCKNGARLI